MMSEIEDQVENEIERNPIEDLIQSALTQDYTAATDIFNDTIGQKMQAALEQEKIGISDQIFNGAEPEEDDIDYEVSDEDIDDQEIEDIYNELDDEEIEEDDE